MRLLSVGADFAALAAIFGAVTKVAPIVVGLIGAVYGLLATINYAFVLYDRVKYGPEVENRRKAIKVLKNLSQTAKEQ